MTDESPDTRLTRRDVIAALTAAGVTVGGGALWASADDPESRGNPTPTATSDATDEMNDEPLGDHELETLIAVAEVVYPSAVENVDEFVTQYARGRVNADPDRGTELADVVAYLDDYVDTWYGEKTYVSLSPSLRDEALRRMGADTVSPDPEGGNVQRVRYYLINELLFALYASPTGGELVGIENPQGHPGGTTSYRKGPRF